MRTKKKAKPPTGDDAVVKVVGLQVIKADLAALGEYREAEGRRAFLVPKEGPAALALFRMGIEAWRAREARGAAS